MKRYQIPTLNEKTPQNDQSKILTAIKGISGVTKATLHPSTHEIEITGEDQAEPKREEIASAVSKVGFPLGPR